MTQQSLFLPARCNPFRSERIDRLPYFFSEATVPELLQTFARMENRAALVAPPGHGKTTLLEQLAAQWAIDHQPLGRQVWWLRLKEGDRCLPSSAWPMIQQQAGREDLIVLDGAEQLRWGQWRKFLRTLQPTQSCLITSHRRGLLATLWDCPTSSELLQQLVQQLQGPLTPQQQSRLKVLFQSQAGDIRQCFRCLYHACAAGEWQWAASDGMR